MNAIHSLTLTVLVDDEAGPKAGCAEHGLSFWIDADCFRILFDSGQGNVLRENMRQLDLNPAEIDAVAISHGHYDHTGGIPKILADCEKASIFLHPDALRRRYSQSSDGGVHPVGFPLSAAELLRSRNDFIRWTKTATRLHSSVFVTGEVPRHVSLEAPAGRFFLDSECLAPDPFSDDQALVVETAEGAIVLLGCSHAGVENSLSCALSHSCTGRLRAVIGGMHLSDASQEGIVGLGDRLEELGPQLICPCHCTGGRAKEYLKKRFPFAYLEGRTGTVLSFNDAA